MSKLFPYFESQVKELCYLSANLGYKMFSDWLIDNITDAAYLIGEYIGNNPDKFQEFLEQNFSTPDDIFYKAEAKRKQMKFLERNGFDIEDISSSTDKEK